MKRLLTIGIILLFIGMSISSSIGFNIERQSTETLDVKTLYVGGSGPGNYTKIQDAIDNASGGDTVFVYNGMYYENVKVNKKINLIGEDRNTTVIDANGWKLPLFLEKSYVTVTGFTLQHSGNKEYNDAGIGIKNLGRTSNWNIINGNKMINNSDGIFMFGSDHNFISNNIIMNNRDDGIYFQEGCDNNTITNNIISNNEGSGINAGNADFNNVSNNYISNNNHKGVGFNGYGNKFFKNIVTQEKIGLKLGMGDQCYSNIFSNNEIGLISSGGLFCSVRKNNFLNNNQHATFTYRPAQRIFTPFFISLQLTKWFRNYWEGHSTGPKIIHGEMTNIQWVNFDFFPAIKPYNIGD